MTKHDLKPIYALNNSDWRIRYQCNGQWELQERIKLPEGTDRRKHQPWQSHNRFMSFDDASARLAAYGVRP